MNNNAAGRWAERLARGIFVLKGFRILAANYVTGRGTQAGEVDFVARRGSLIVFAEVKQRSSLEKAAYAISEKQKRRIINGAAAFLQKHPELNGCDIRFDAVLVELPFKIRHIKNAWSEY